MIPALANRRIHSRKGGIILRANKDVAVAPLGPCGLDGFGFGAVLRRRHDPTEHSYFLKQMHRYRFSRFCFRSLPPIRNRNIWLYHFETFPVVAFGLIDCAVLE